MKIAIHELKETNSNNEKLVLKVLEDCNTAGYMIMDTTYDGDGHPSNIFRHCYIFPKKEVKRGDYIWLFTGKGNNTSYANKGRTITHEFYWGSDELIWNNETDIAYLLHYDDWESKKFE